MRAERAPPTWVQRGSPVRRVLDFTGLPRVIPLEARLEDALAQLDPGPDPRRCTLQGRNEVPDTLDARMVEDARPLLEVTDRIVSFEWTLATLQELHHDLNKAMKNELTLIASRGREPVLERTAG